MKTEKQRVKAEQELYCLEGALAEAKRLIRGGAKPEEIMRDFTKTKTSSSWITVVFYMANWWNNYKRRHDG